MTTQLAIVALGVAGTVLGLIVGAWLQRFAWRRQSFLDQAKQANADLNDLFERLTRIVDRRYYALFKWNQALREGLGAQELEHRIDHYFEIVAEWNDNLRLFHNQLRIHLGEPTALAFLDYADDFRQDDPRCLHYRFVIATRLMRAATADGRELETATLSMERLNWTLTAFANDTANELMRRAENLRRLDWSSEPAAGNGLLTAGPNRAGLPADPKHPGLPNA